MLPSCGFLGDERRKNWSLSGPGGHTFTPASFQNTELVNDHMPIWRFWSPAPHHPPTTADLWEHFLTRPQRRRRMQS